MSFLLDSTTKVSLILLAALGASLLLRRRSAAVRHWVLAVAIVCGTVAPLVATFVPSWHVDVPIPLRSQERTRAVSSTTTSMEPLVAGLPSALGSPSAAAPAVTAPGVPGLLLLIWTAGVLVNLSILFAGLTRLTSLARAARRIEHGRLEELTQEISLSLRLRRRVVLLQSDHPTMLGTWGVARPKVLLPAAARSWPDDRVRIVLNHELAHVQRADWAVQVTAELLRAVYWFNPLVWFACRRLRQESEQACDDAVLSAGVRGTEYASHLLDLARTLNGTSRGWLPASAMARPSSLKGRVAAMLNTSVNRHPLAGSVRAATAAALLILTLSIAGFAAQSFFTFSGSLMDPTNHSLPRATLVLTSVGNEAKHEVKSDAAGHFEFVGVPPGEYVLEVRLPGFAVYKDSFAVSRNLDRTIELQVGSLQETLTVGGEARSEPATDQQEAAQRARTQFEEMRQANLKKCSTDGTSVGGRIMPPVRLVDVRPAYPEALRSERVGGTVTMDAIIGTDGMMREVQAVSSPHPDLEHAAVEAVRQWQYSQTLLNCVPIEVRMKVTTRFDSQQ